MPNWCSNNISISHENPEMVARIKTAIDKNNLFGEFVPLSNNKWEYFDAMQTWGTKWEASCIDIMNEAATGLDLMFDTAWGPPIKFYDKMTELGFNIDARYHEPGMCFAGHYNSTDGDTIYEYDFSDEDWKTGIDDEDVLDMLEAEYEVYEQMNGEQEDDDEDNDIQQT